MYRLSRIYTKSIFIHYEKAASDETAFNFIKYYQRILISPIRGRGLSLALHALTRLMIAKTNTTRLMIPEIYFIMGM